MVERTPVTDIWQRESNAGDRYEDVSVTYQLRVLKMELVNSFRTLATRVRVQFARCIQLDTRQTYG